MKKRVGAKMKKNLRTTAADGEAAKLPAKVRTEILEAIKILGSLEVEVIAGPEGTLFRIGSEAGNHRELLWDGYQSEEIYRLYLTSYNIERVLRQAEQFAPDRTEIVFTGPDSPVAVSVGSYTYYLNPVAECKEEDPSYEPAVSSVQSKI